MPLGIIKDANPNQNQVDVYGLVLGTTVVNTILCSYNEILYISESYDYCVDITMQGQAAASIGWSYNASEDSFSAPPPPTIDWVTNVEGDFDSVISALQQTIADCGSSGGSLTSDQITQAYNSALNDNPGLDEATQNLMVSILDYVLAGG